jgi:hypothetical protein
MRYLSIFCVLFFPTVGFAGDKLTPRPLDPISAETLAHAIERSAITRTLIEHLESSNVIVHIVTAAQMEYGIGGTTRFVTSRGGYRYLRITLAAGLPLKHRSAILAHELQHAWEVARSAATEVEEIKRLFENEGHRASEYGEYYETRAAIEIERNVRMELTAGRALRLRSGQALQTEPVVKFHH